jgi:ribokinase
MEAHHLAVGNLNLDMYIVVEELPGRDEDVHAVDAYIGPGGAAANYAVSAVLAGHKATLLAHTGSEAEQMGILKKLVEVGVDTSQIVVHSGAPPGIVLILVSRLTGERMMVTLRGANKFLSGTEIENKYYDVVHVASVEPHIFINTVKRVRPRIASYDPGASVTREYKGKLVSVVEEADVIYLNRAEYRMVFNEEFNVDTLLKITRRHPNTIIVVKLGAQGAVAGWKGKAYLVEAYKHGVTVDTTGAGDVFAAYFNSYLAEGKSIEEGLVAASVAAGIKVTRRGAQSAPSRREVEEVLGTAKKPRVQRLS